MSALIRKSVTDLTRRKARTFFTVLTLALAVASIGLFAVPSVMQQAMDREVTANRSADVTVSMRPLGLSAAQLARARSLPNVTAVEPRSSFLTRVWVGEGASRRSSSACPTTPASASTSSPSTRARLRRRRPS